MGRLMETRSGSLDGDVQSLDGDASSLDGDASSLDGDLQMHCVGNTIARD